MNPMKMHYGASLAVIAACTIGFGIIGCASSFPPDSGNTVLYTYQPELTEQGTGREIYLQRCATCHGPDGQGTKGLEIPATGPALKGDPFILAAPDALITQVIRHGRTGAKRLYDDTFPDMPSFDATLIPDLRPLIAYLKGGMQKPGNTATSQ